MDATSRAMTDEWQSTLRRLYQVCVGDLLDGGDAAPESVEERRRWLEDTIRDVWGRGNPRMSDRERDTWTDNLLNWLEADHRAGGTLGAFGPQVTYVPEIRISGLPGDDTA